MWPAAPEDNRDAFDGLIFNARGLLCSKRVLCIRVVPKTQGSVFVAAFENGQVGQGYNPFVAPSDPSTYMSMYVLVHGGHSDTEERHRSGV